MFIKLSKSFHEQIFQGIIDLMIFTLGWIMFIKVFSL